MFKTGAKKTLEAEPITEAYFSKSWGAGIKTNSKIRIKVLLAIVLLILLLSIVNYVNYCVINLAFIRCELCKFNHCTGGFSQ